MDDPEMVRALDAYESHSSACGHGIDEYEQRDAARAKIEALIASGIEDAVAKERERIGEDLARMDAARDDVVLRDYADELRATK